MNNVTLIATIHSENGKCNSDELYKIIESINPQVIFDELPSHISDMFYSDSFDKYYSEKVKTNKQLPELPLEVKSIKKYKLNYKVKIIPVDIDLTQKLSEHQHEIFILFQTLFKNEDYINIDNEKKILIAKEGFDFLNGNIFLDFLEKKEVLEKKIIESDIQKNILIKIYKLFRTEQIDNRENEMLKNIYNYSKENKYDQAVFLIGAEHKKSIMEKITKYENISEIKLNWTMYNKTCI